MKKCTKKIPKHNAGAIVGNSLNFVGDMAQNVVRSQNEGVSFGSVLGGMGKGAATGATLGSVIPGIGTIIGGIGGAVIGGVTSAVGQSGSVDENTGEVTKSSGLTRLFGWDRSDKSLYAKSNRIKTSNVDKLLTPYMNEQFMSDPYNNLNTNVYVNAAEGGIVPGEHYASRREVEVAADGTNAVRYPWDPDGKDTYHVYTNPDGSSAMGNYVFTEEGVRRPNGEKYSDAAEKIIKGTEEGSKLRQIELRKLANEMEEQKMNKGIKKIKKGIPAHEEGLNPYSYNKNLTEFAYWDKDKNEYKKEYLDWVKNLTEQDVRDIESEKYGDMSEYFSKNKGKKLDVATAQKLMTDKKYGNWHKIGQAIVDNKIKTKGPALDNVPHMAKQINIFPGMKERVVHHVAGDGDNKAELTHLYTQGLEIPKLKKLSNPSEADGVIAAYKAQNKGKGTPDWLSNIVDFAPMAAALFGDYDYHTEQAQISPAKYIPTGVSIDPIRRAADESYAMARYNQANISPNTGAGMAYGLQAASNRAKTLADAYTWQQDAQNKRIAQNVGIYNDWSKRYDAARYQAIADTRANEAAAQQMRDSAIRDAYEFTTGRRNDRWKLSMLEPMFKYAVDDNIWKNFKIA